MPEQKPRKFKAKREISNCNYGDSYTVLFGEIIEMCDSENVMPEPECFPSRRKDGSMWWYNFSDFEEVFEGEKVKTRSFEAIKNTIFLKKGEIIHTDHVSDTRLFYKGCCYLLENFKEIIDGIPTSNDVLFTKEGSLIKVIDHLPIQSLLSTKVSIDDLIKLKSVFSFDEIVQMIEKGIV